MIPTAILDYFRGKGKYKTIFKLFYGLLICLLAGIQGYHLIIGSILFAIGISIGWGNPIGAGLKGRTPEEHKNIINDKFEWWQIGVLRQNTYLALAVRGALTGVLLIPYTITVLLAYTVAFPLAVYIAYKIKPLPDSWALQELLRGFIGGLIVWLL